MRKGWNSSELNANRNTFVEFELKPPLGLKWKRRFNGPLLHPLCVDQGRVILSALGDNAHLYMVNSEVNRIVWKKPWSKNPSFALFGNILFVTSNPSKLLDASTGGILHEYDFSGGLLVSSSDDDLYLAATFIGENEQTIFRANPVLREREIVYEQSGLEVGLVTYARGRAVFLTTPDRLIQIDVATKEKVWEVKLPRRDGSLPIHAPMIVDGLLTLSFEDGLMILNHETGSEIGFVPYLRRMMPTGPASADEEAIFVNIWNIYRISKNNFAIEWTYKTNKTYMDGFAIISGNYLYVANHLGMVLALNKRTGEPVWSFQTEGGGYILLCMAVADDKLFVGNSMGYFYCFVEDR